MAAIIPYLLVFGSAAVAAEGRHHVDDRQKRLMDAMQQYKLGKARTGQAAIEDFTKNITPEARANQNLAAKEELSKGLEASAATTQAYEKPTNFSGKVSDAYTGRVATNAATNADRLKRAIDQLSTIGVPGEAGLKTQFAFGRAAGDVDASNLAARRVGGAYENAAANVRPGMWQDFLSQVMLGGGLGMAGGTPAPKVRKTSGLYDFGPNVPSEYP